MKKQYRGYVFVVGAAAASTLSGAVGCDGSSSDCLASRTCAATDEAGAAGAAHEPDVGAHGGDADGRNGSDGGRPDAVGGEATESGGAATGQGGRDGDDPGVASAGNGNVEASAGAGGSHEAPNPPPTIVSVTPSNAAANVEPDANVVIKFSEALDPATITSTTIRVLDGSSAVAGTLVHVKDTVTFKPSSRFALLAPYKVSVTTGVADEAGARLSSAYTSAFSVREGTWNTVDVVKDKLNALSDVLPISSAGDVLVAWSGAAGAQCPVSARWFLRGAGAAAATSFSVANQTKCAFVTSAGNAVGVGAALWSAPNVAHGVYAPQYRAGAWPATVQSVSDQSSESMTAPRLAVSPSGKVTFFEHTSTGAKAWTTDANGAWPASGEEVSPFTAETATSVAFDSTGNGLAIWHAHDPAGKKVSRMQASRFTVASGKWGAAGDVPGSVAATPNASRGAPVVAFDGNGDGMALWVDAVSANTLMANRFTQASGWAGAQAISGALVVTVDDPPALTFDGQGFVAAFTAFDGAKPYTYTARFNLVTGWEDPQRRQANAADTVAARMPRLVSDGRGNLMLVFAKGAGSAFTLMYQRYAAGAWGVINPLPGGSITSSAFLVASALPMSMNSSGMAALAWGNYDATNVMTGIRLASFY